MYIGVDLGSTNLKAAIYDKEFNLIDRQDRPVQYIRENGFVEFDAVKYFNDLVGLLKDMLSQHKITKVEQIAFTGQAESLVVLDKQGRPMMNAISWMDERSVDECKTLAEQFSAETCEAITGQMAVLPTWPATKILWLKNNRPEIYNNAGTYMLLKDYIVYGLTGNKLADMSVATFSFYFDIYNKVYWQDMLSAIGVSETQLPQLCEPCSVAGNTTDAITEALGLAEATVINVGTLDHFAGMIGTGNTQPGGITLSTGTVMALTVMADGEKAKSSGIAMHYGYLPNTHIMLPVAESGGVSLEWFRRTCMGTTGYDVMNEELAKREPTELLFLPYLVGTNAPEFDAEATGSFWGLRQEHDCIDMAGAVMEGVSFVLRKNCDKMAANGATLQRIIATGGGAKSAYWCQLHADITGIPVVIPAEKEAACLGAAMIAAVGAGRFENFNTAADHCVRLCHSYTPNRTERIEKKYRRFCALYEAGLQIANME